MSKKVQERTLLDFLQEVEEKESKAVEEKSEPTNSVAFPLVTAEDYRRNFSKSDKLITAPIQDIDTTEAFNKSDFHFLNVLASLAQNHQCKEDVPDFFYVSSSELAKMLGISRQTASTKFTDSKGNTFTYIEKRLLSLSKKAFFIKEALIPVVEKGMYVKDKDGRLLYRNEKNYVFSCVYSFSTVAKIKGSNVLKIQLAPIFFFYNNLQFLNQKMNGVAYTRINIDLVGSLNDHRAMRMYEIVKIKSLGIDEGSFRIRKSELIEILDVHSSRLKQFLKRVEKNLEKVMSFSFEIEKVGGTSFVHITYKFHNL